MQVEERMRFYDEGVAPRKNATVMAEAVASFKDALDDDDGDVDMAAMDTPATIASEEGDGKKKKKKKSKKREAVRGCRLPLPVRASTDYCIETSSGCMHHRCSACQWRWSEMACPTPVRCKYHCNRWGGWAVASGCTGDR